MSCVAKETTRLSRKSGRAVKTNFYLSINCAVDIRRCADYAEIKFVVNEKLHYNVCEFMYTVYTDVLVLQYFSYIQVVDGESVIDLPLRNF